MNLRRPIVKKFLIVLVALALAGGLQAATRTTAFEVNGWTCGSCAAATRIALKKLDGVADVRTDAEKKEAVVTYDDSKVTASRMVQAIEKLGYRARVKNGEVPAAAQRSLDTAPPVRAKDTTASSAGVSFFEVPLTCGAAEGLGCGSEAKPILKELDRNPRIAEARINHAGTVLAVTWKDPKRRSDGTVETLFEKHHLAAAPLQGDARDKALAEFRSQEWYGAADVDRLSEHEARVIAGRLVNRARSRLDLPPERLAALTEDLALVFARHLTKRDEECDPRREIIDQELTVAASKYLNTQQLAELRKAGEQGIQALPGEEN
jgi:mercuric ion binding protein